MGINEYYRFLDDKYTHLLRCETMSSTHIKVSHDFFEEHKNFDYIPQQQKLNKNGKVIFTINNKKGS